MRIDNLATHGLSPELRSTVKRFAESSNQIPEERREALDAFAKLISKSSDAPMNLIFVCTHNSRRSHVTMIWAQLAARLNGRSDVFTFSGGTEVTAFNARGIDALRRVGFDMDVPPGENPKVEVGFGERSEKLICFSKRYDESPNPESDFIAVMTCAHADEHCPYLPGAKHRFPLRYIDPGHADGSPEEVTAYDSLVEQVGREMLYVFAKR